ncbi:MAG: hypothetical protein WBF40_05605 [Methyloceanibacter sp.]
MKNLSFVIAMLFAAFGLPAFAAEDAPQPLTRAACDQPGMKWNDSANVCGDKKVHDKDKKDKKQKHHGDKDQPLAEGAPQPLTRGACDQAGLKWKDSANVCGDKKVHDKEKKKAKKQKHHGDKDQPLAERKPQPLTRAACDQAGMKWSERANVFGVKKAHDKKKKAKKKKKHEKKHGKKKHGDGAKHDGQGAKDKDKDKGGFKWPWEKKTKDGS